MLASDQSGSKWWLASGGDGDVGESVMMTSVFATPSSFLSMFS
jgi:hypothetical protein